MLNSDQMHSGTQCTALERFGLPGAIVMKDKQNGELLQSFINMVERVRVMGALFCGNCVN